MKIVQLIVKHLSVKLKVFCKKVENPQGKMAHRCCTNVWGKTRQLAQIEKNDRECLIYSFIMTIEKNT